MPLTIAQITAAATHEALFQIIGLELTERLTTAEPDDLDDFLARTRRLPIGLRAMAATYQLDVSLTLDDFGWHFANWHHHAYCDETHWALRELEAFEQADLFAQAYAAALPFWRKIGDLVAEDFDDFVTWYAASGFEAAILPMTERMRELQKIDDGLFGCWSRYARKYPERMVVMQ
jgi:hypothetical protein